MPAQLRYFFTRSLWLLFAAALLILIISQCLLVFSAWRHLDYIDPLQRQLQQLSAFEVGGSYSQAHIRKLNAGSPQAQPRPALPVDPAKPSPLAPVQILPPPLPVAAALIQGELKALHSLVYGQKLEAQRSLRIVLGLAAALVVIALLLWLKVRGRILGPLQRLTHQMTLLAHRDYSELERDNADPMLYPMIEKYNAMAQRLMQLEQEQQQRQASLSEDVRQAASLLMQQQHSLARAERLGAVGEMAAGIAHELRNPLASIQVALENLHGELHEPSIQARTSLILEEIRGVNRQLTQLLDQARQEPEAAVAMEVNKELANLLSLSSYQLGPALKLRLEPGDHPVGFLPRTRFRQAVLNLILNAGQAMTGSAGLVAVEARCIANRLTLTVCDSGPGFPEPMLKQGIRCFHSRRPGGTGLGLSMVRRFVDDLGGSLTLDNLPGGGACVTLALPWRPAND